MAPERHSKKTMKVFFLKNSEEYFLKTLRRIFSKLWEAFSQNKRHPCATLKIISTKMVIFSPRTLFVSATFYGQEHTPLYQARLFAKFYLVSHPGRKVNMLCICCLLPGVLVSSQALSKVYLVSQPGRKVKHALHLLFITWCTCIKPGS